MALFTGSWDRLLQLLLDQRDVNLIGRKGSGKTLLGFAILDHLVKAKLIDGVVANIGCDLPIHNWKEVLPPGYGWPERLRLIEGAGIWIDEAGTVLDNRTSVVNPSGLGRYGRKFRNITVLSSVTPIDKRYTYLQIGPGPKMAGRWQFWWSLTDAKGALQETGTFWLMNPEVYYGKFSTHATPVDDAEILSLWEYTLVDRIKDAPTKQKWFVERTITVESDGASGPRDNYARVRGLNAGMGAFVGERPGI